MPCAQQRPRGGGAAGSSASLPCRLAPGTAARGTVGLQGRMARCRPSAPALPPVPRGADAGPMVTTRCPLLPAAPLRRLGK